MGSILCEHCTAACCRYVAVPLDRPRTVRDYDDVRWYLMHQGVTVFVEDGDWYIQYQTRCKNLAADNRCGIYTTRPVICRGYEPGDCDYAGGAYGYDNLFTHPGQIDEYYETKTGRKLPPPAEIAAPRPKAKKSKRQKIKKGKSPC
jgi:Fe-S-cluster containining protein